MRFDQVVKRDIRAHVWDYGLSGAMIGVAVVALITRIDVQDADTNLFKTDTWWAWVATIAVCATLSGRRRWPLWSLACGLLLVLPIELAHQRDTTAFFAEVIALYSVAAHLPPRLAIRGVGITAAFYAVLLASETVALVSVSILGVLFLAAAFALGLIIQRSRTRQQDAAQDAIEQAATAIEVTELEAANERLRLARELHDVLAHSLSVIAVQAGIGAHLIDRRPLEASRALDAILATCQSTTGELDRLVGILRNGAADDSSPAPTISDVTALVDQIRGADLPVNLVVTGDLGAVPSGASLAVYRIVQEALTNVVLHAGSGAAATVTIQATTTDIGVTIDDNGRGVAAQNNSPRGGGNGILGMSERARLYGGQVQSGPRPGGGFRVRANLNFSSDTSEGPKQPNDRADCEPVPQAHRRRFASLPWDVALAASIATISVVELIATHPTAAGPHFTPTNLWAFVLRFASFATLTFRRRYPTTAYAVAGALYLALTIGDYQVGVVTLVLLIGLYSVAAHATTRYLIRASIGTALGMTVIAWSKPPGTGTGQIVWAGLFFAASAITGYTVRRDRDRHATELVASRTASAAHARHARLMLSNERLRIADELGGIITRSIGIIAHEAETGAPFVATDMYKARDALHSISTTSRDALSDVRRLLKHMRASPTSTAYSPIVSAFDSTSTDAVGVPV